MPGQGGEKRLPPRWLALASVAVVAVAVVGASGVIQIEAATGGSAPKSSTAASGVVGLPSAHADAFSTNEVLDVAGDGVTLLESGEFSPARRRAKAAGGYGAASYGARRAPAARGLGHGAGNELPQRRLQESGTGGSGRGSGGGSTPGSRSGGSSAQEEVEQGLLEEEQKEIDMFLGIFLALVVMTGGMLIVYALRRYKLSWFPEAWVFFGIGECDAAAAAAARALLTRQPGPCLLRECFVTGGKPQLRY